MRARRVPRRVTKGACAERYAGTGKRKFQRLVLNCLDPSCKRLHSRSRVLLTALVRTDPPFAELPASTTPEGEDIQHMRATWKRSAAALMALSVIAAAC